MLAGVALVMHRGQLLKPPAYAVDGVSLGMTEAEVRTIWEGKGRQCLTLRNGHTGELVLCSWPRQPESPEVRFDYQDKAALVTGYQLSRGSVSLLQQDDLQARVEGLGTGSAPDVGWECYKREGESISNRLVEGGVVTAKSRRVNPILRLPGFKKEPMSRVFLIQLQTMEIYDRSAGKRVSEEESTKAGP